MKRYLHSFRFLTRSIPFSIQYSYFSTIAAIAPIKIQEEILNPFIMECGKDISERVKPKFDDFIRSWTINTFRLHKISIQEAKILLDSIHSILPEHLNFIGCIFLDNALPMSYSEMIANRIHELKVDDYSREFLVRFYARLKEERKAMFYYRQLKSLRKKDNLLPNVVVEDLFTMKILLKQNYMEFYRIEMQPLKKKLETKFFNSMLHTLLHSYDFDGFPIVLEAMHQCQIQMDSKTRELLILYTIKTSNDNKYIKKLMDDNMETFSFLGGCAIMKALFDRGFYVWGLELFAHIKTIKTTSDPRHLNMLVSYFIQPKSKDNSLITDQLLLETITKMKEEKIPFQPIFVKVLLGYLRQTMSDLIQQNVTLLYPLKEQILRTLLKIISDHKIKLESYLYAHIIVYASTLDRIDLVDEVRKVAEEYSYSCLSLFYFNAVAQAYQKVSWEKYGSVLEWIFKEMKQRNCKPNLCIFYTLFVHFQHHSKNREALYVFEKIIHPFVMKKEAKHISSVNLVDLYQRAKMIYQSTGNRAQIISIQNQMAQWNLIVPNDEELHPPFEVNHDPVPFVQ